MASYRRSRSLYRVLARILPRELRHEAGPALEEAAIACLQRERDRLGAAGFLIGWARLVVDTAVAAAAERRSSRVEKYVPLALDRFPNRQGVVPSMIDALRKDIRYALRSLARQPGFTLVMVLTLALGIGANTAVFSVVNGVLLRPLPYPQPERLFYVTSQFPSLGFDQFWISLPEFVEFRDHNQAFSSVGAYNVGAANLGTLPPSRPVRAVVTPELMPALGVPALMGRWFTPADSAPNAPLVAILSWELWQREFGGRPDIVGQTVQINNQSNQIAGVMPRGYDVHDQKVELWQPLTIDPATFPNRRGGHFLYLVGRLKDGVTEAQARADIDRLVNQWAKMVPDTHVPTPKNAATGGGHPIRIDPLHEDIIGGVRRALVMLQVAVGLVLLIACSNLANLLVARADARMREYAVRSALGATRLRLFRQMLTEGLVLTIAASLVGVGLAYGGLSTLLAVNPDAIPRTAEIGIDGAVLAFTLAVAAGTGIVFALVPLLHLGATRAMQALRESTTRTTAGKARLAMRSVLVIGEIALAVTLVVGAGLLIRSFMNLMRVDMGFNRSGLTTFGVVTPPATYNPQQRVAMFNRILERIQQVPGVQTAAAMSGLPPLRSVNANDTNFEHIPDNRPPGSVPIENVDYYQTVTLNYAETMGIPIVEGRSFQLSDVGGPPVLLVNESLVRKFFTDRPAIGGRMKPGIGPFDKVPWFTIVGVLKDVKQGGVSEPTGTELYVLNDQGPPIANQASPQMNLVVRSTLPFETLAPEFRRIVQELDPQLPIVRMRTMDEVVLTAVARPRFLTVLLGIFAGLALVLAAVGTYGILAFLVSERRHEIGIRMALGADRSRILRSVLARGLLLSGVGVGLGLLASLGLTRLIETLLFNVTPNDPVTIVMVAGVMAVVAAAACFIPAWRATRVSPLEVLREA